jgi:hypothetical protein
MKTFGWFLCWLGIAQIMEITYGAVAAMYPDQIYYHPGLGPIDYVIMVIAVPLGSLLFAGVRRWRYHKSGREAMLELREVAGTLIGIVFTLVVLIFALGSFIDSWAWVISWFR